LALTQARTGTHTRPATAAAALTAPVVGVAVAVVALAAYLATMAPDLYSLDSPELTTAAYRLGIAHAPGYPLYTLAGWLFSHAFPVSNVAFRLNLLSVLFGVAATVTVYALALRLTVRPLVAASGALALAFSYWFWSDALAAEVYTLDAALYAGLLLAAFAWRSSPTAPRAAMVGLLFGLGCATRTTTLLYLPALVAFAFVAGERSPRAYGAAALGAAAGLAFYLYLPLRSAAGVHVGPGDYASDGSLRVIDLASLSGLWEHVSAAAFRGDAFAYGPVGMLRETGTFVVRLSGSFLLVGIPLGVAGIVRQWRADRAALLLIAGTALPVTVFFINYGALDKEFMFLPAYAAWALWLVAGLDWMLDAFVAADAPRTTALAISGLALTLPAAAFAVNVALVSLHGERAVRNDAEQFLDGLPQGALVYGRFTDVAPYQYLQQVEGRRTDVALVNAWTVDDATLARLAAANVGSRPFFLAGDERSLHGQYQLVRYGEHGFEVRPRPASAPLPGAGP
jgi:hypothetical protein